MNAEEIAASDRLRVGLCADWGQANEANGSERGSTFCVCEQGIRESGIVKPLKLRWGVVGTNGRALKFCPLQVNAAVAVSQWVVREQF